MIRYIYHLSDIHIRNDRWDEYHQVFIKTRDKLLSLVDDRSLIVITGDILHFKTDLTPESVQLTKIFLDMMRSICDTIIIAGNHDCNQSNRSKIDSLTTLFPLSSNDKYLIDEKDNILCYLRRSGHYRYHNIVFGLSSLIDGRFVKAKRSCQYSIALHHGSKFSLDQFQGYDYVLLGHLHTPKMIASNIGYSGSLIQQSFAETVDNHGFLAWDLEAGITTFHQIDNDYAYITIKAYVIDMPRYVRLRIITNSLSDISQIINKVKERSTILQLTRIDKDFETLFDHKNVDIDSSYQSWEINEVCFSNLFCYGEDNRIVFDRYKKHRSIGIVAPNRYGKSAIIDIILICLFDRCKRSNMHQAVRIEPAICSLTFTVGSVRYKVIRKILNNKASIELFKGVDNLTQSCKNKTDAVIKGLVGNMNDYLNTSIWMGYDTGFIDMNRSEKIRFIKQLLSIPENEQKCKVTKALMNQYVCDHDIDEVKKRLRDLREIDVTDMMVNQLDEKKSIKQMFIDLTQSITECQEILDNHDRYLKYREMYEHEQKMLQKYQSELDDVMMAVLPVIVSKVNDLLKLWVSFKIDMRYVNRDVIIGIYSDGLIDIKQCSGFERFVVNLCLRIVWMHCSRISKPDFFVIDEGWICVDKDNRKICQKIVKELSDIVPRLILISHLSEIQDLMRYKIKIIHQDV